MSFLLVHGGAHGAWCWEPLLPHLAAPARAVDLPGRGARPADLESLTLDDWVDALVEDVEAFGDEPIILVGHSLAGVSMPRVAERVPERIAQLVFVSCTVPGEGQSVLEVLAPDIERSSRENRERPTAAVLPEEISRQMFCSDMDEVQTRFVLDRLVPEAWQPMRAPTRLAGLRAGIPAIYVKLLKDQSVPPELQDTMIRNVGEPRVVEIDAGHNVMVSQPEALARILNELVAGR